MTVSAHQFPASRRSVASAPASFVARLPASFAVLLPSLGVSLPKLGRASGSGSLFDFVGACLSSDRGLAVSRTTPVPTNFSSQGLDTALGARPAGAGAKDCRPTNSSAKSPMDCHPSPQSPSAMLRTGLCAI